MIYTGKAKQLRNLIRSYFQQSKHQSAKDISLIKWIADVEWIVVLSEIEALLIEDDIIKKHQPRFNGMGLMIVNLYIIPHRDYEGSYCNCYYIPKLYPT